MVQKNSDKHFIRIKEEVIDVSEEIYNFYYSSKRREKYMQEKDRKEGLLSLDHEYEMCTLYELVAYKQKDVLNQLVLKDLINELNLVLKQLDELELKLIKEHYYNKVSLRTYAQIEGVTHRTIMKRRNRILSKIRILMEIEKYEGIQINELLD